MKHRLTVFFKLDLITKFMDKFDMTDGSRKIFCKPFDIEADTTDDWSLSPGVVEVLERAFIDEGVVAKMGAEDNPYICGIYDHAVGVFYNFTDEKDNITMFSDGKNFAHFDTKRDMHEQKYIDAYRKFVFSDKQAKNDKYIYYLTGWMKCIMEGNNEVCQ